MKSYEIAYDKFIEACGKWAETELKWANLPSGRSNDGRVLGEYAADAKRKAQHALNAYIGMRRDYEFKHGDKK